jgi:hypothetical protein
LQVGTKLKGGVALGQARTLGGSAIKLKKHLVGFDTMLVTDNTRLLEA